MTQLDDDYWREQVGIARRTQLTVVRDAAKAWAGVFSGILGLFGTVTFVGGLNGLDDLAAKDQEWIRFAIVVAAISLLVATVLSALASNAIPVVADKMTGDGFRDRSKELARRSLRFFRVSMVFALIAASIVIFGSGYILFTSTAEDAEHKPPKVVAVIDGTAYCGPLSLADGILAVDGKALKSVTLLTPVDTCP